MTDLRRPVQEEFLKIEAKGRGTLPTMRREFSTRAGITAASISR